jgi:hypothetical protein
MYFLRDSTGIRNLLSEISVEYFVGNALFNYVTRIGI